MTIPIFDLGFGPLQSKKILRAAEMPDLYQTLRTGEYQFGWPWSYFDGAPVLVANTLYAVPMMVARSITIDRLGINVTTLAAGASARIGIYKPGTNVTPGARLLDAGTVSVATTGFKEITGLSQAITTLGVHFLVVVSDGAPTLAGGALAFSPLGNSATSGYDLSNRWQVAFTYAALPDPFTAGGAVNANQAPFIVYRLLSLD